MKQQTKQTDNAAGERYARESARYGKIAAEHLFRAQWSYDTPEWYDHRLHWLDPEHHFTDFWTMSADNVIRVLPLGGRLLDLCSGDGFYDYYWYKLRAQVTCIERSKEAHEFAVKHHWHPRIKYILGDILTEPFEAETYDVVLIRGAIEHFSWDNQQLIISKSHAALKAGGYFCGDTPAADPEQDKLLASHEYEWRNEAEMKAALETTFSNIETFALESDTDLHNGNPNGSPGKRTTLFWRCRK